MPRRPVPARPGPEDSRPGAQPDPEKWQDQDSPPPPGQDELTPQEIAEIREAAADEMLALKAADTGRRGPGQPGSARVFPGESASAAGGFGPGLARDMTPGCAGLALAADAAAGDQDRFDGASDAELIGVVCAWDRWRRMLRPASWPRSPR